MTVDSRASARCPGKRRSLHVDRPLDASRNTQSDAPSPPEVNRDTEHRGRTLASYPAIE
jgi:hypothetical protein